MPLRNRPSKPIKRLEASGFSRQQAKEVTITIHNLGVTKTDLDLKLSELNRSFGEKIKDSREHTTRTARASVGVLLGGVTTVIIALDYFDYGIRTVKVEPVT